MTPRGEKRQRAIMENAETLLPSRGYGDGHNFMLSGEEALAVGEAVANRNHKVLRDILAGAIDQLEDHYETLTIDELRGAWDKEVQRVTGNEGSVSDFIHNAHKRELLEDVLAGRTDAKLELYPITYIKLLETLVYATAPEGMETFDPRYATAPRYRKVRGNIHARCLNTLERLCEQEPGVRDIREKLLQGDESALDTYLASLSRMRVAQKAYANIIETFQAGHADDVRASVLQQLEVADNFDELLDTHILNWEMLPCEVSDSSDRNRIIRKLIEDRTPEQKRSAIADNWSDERIDVLFDTAHLATRRGRKAEIYVSSTFDNGAGVYLAAVLTHPIDPEKSLVVADNPLKGNALYIVDEQLTEFDDVTDLQYRWREVMGSHKQVARARGARRRYHTGDWSQLPQAVCEYGGNYKLAEQKRKQHEQEKSDTSETPVDISAALLRAIEQSRIVSLRYTIDKK